LPVELFVGGGRRLVVAAQMGFVAALPGFVEEIGVARLRQQANREYAGDGPGQRLPRR
jgi:hypothetical protein